jgi:glucosamine--fructose-6-phosphate aminotransferase (isomerizing)
MSRFLEEIRSQPEVLRGRLALGSDDVEAAAASLRGVRGLMIVARGSSDHAAVYAKYLFEMRNRLPVALAAPSEYTIYGRPPRLDGLGVLAISQSGVSPDVVAVIEEARRQGCPTIALVNDPESPLAHAAGRLIGIGAGVERSVPASKTYTATLLCLAMVSAALDPDTNFESAIQAVPEAAAAALGAGAERLAAAIDDERMAVVARGYHLSTALEIALKVTETCRLLAEARSSADFLHGPIAAARPGLPVLLLAAAGPAMSGLRALRGELQARRALVLAIGDREVEGDQAVQLETGLPEELTPIPFAIAGQVLANALAVHRGLDPDHPAGLHKVTETR